MHIIINYSITVYSNPLTMAFIIPTVKTFPSFSGDLAMMRHRDTDTDTEETIRKTGSKGTRTSKTR